MAIETTDYPRGLTFEKVWAALMENRIQLKENAERQAEITAQMQKETAQMLKENAKLQAETTAQIQKETAQMKKETDRQIKETDRQIKEFNKRFGDFTNRFGEIVEHMIAPNLRTKFAELGLVFPKANKETEISDKENNISLEIDIMLENGEKALLVETKTKPTIQDVKDHVKRLEKMKRYADLHGDKRKFLGAIAGVVLSDNVKEFILKNGFFAVVPSGETFVITPPGKDTREW